MGGRTWGCSSRGTAPQTDKNRRTTPPGQPPLQHSTAQRNLGTTHRKRVVLVQLISTALLCTLCLLRAALGPGALRGPGGLAAPAPTAALGLKCLGVLQWEGAGGRRQMGKGRVS